MNGKMRSSVMGLILGQFSSPLPEVKKEPVAYLYNGVRLPKLPEWDREKYPYAVITVANYADGNIARLHFFKSYVYKSHHTSSGYGWEGITVTSDSCRYDCKSVQDGWVLGETFTDNHNIIACENIQPEPKTNAAWGNIEFVCQTDYVYPVGTVILTPSEPIPVYE